MEMKTNTHVEHDKHEMLTPFKTNANAIDDMIRPLR